MSKALVLISRNKAALATALLVASLSSAHAAAGDPPDTSAIVTYITAAGVTLALVANAKLLMELGVKAFRWIRQALGG